MERLPLFFDLAGREVLLAGDGAAADAKRRLIEAAGGRIVSQPSAQTRLAFVTGESEEVAAVAESLRSSGLLVNVVDRADLSDFIVPAIVDRSPVVVAIGTNGTSATLAKVLRERFEALLPAALGRLARGVAAERRSLATRLARPEQRRRLWDRLMAGGGALDPFGEPADVAGAIDAALADDAPADPVLVCLGLSSDDPDDLTLRQLRQLSQADTLFYAPTAPAAVLDRARRDAVRIAVDEIPGALPPGLSLFVYRIA